ncbi:glycosyltransferase involved in cell wall biosynthesis [Naumannella cuiyingiana]|uniref:Glycosyltransferase involved in cell wall biosynthesis n=1 Tax=Naumannella cuiyingiana TaxID=1347891 RepID=A0A7Z0ILB2_9ACTN|nr:glycosyltransferase family 4 protein [Naumannella cuiyingiana]NYI71450.1 glycosyltransferase involved in cell wall biosynthesis [Naumannella cuiyingiana]
MHSELAPAPGSTSTVSALLDAHESASDGDQLWTRASAVVREHADTLVARQFLLGLLEHSPDPSKAVFAHTLFHREGLSLLAQIAASGADVANAPKDWQRRALRKSLEAVPATAPPVLVSAFAAEPSAAWAPPDALVVPGLAGAADVSAGALAVVQAFVAQAGEDHPGLSFVWFHDHPPGSVAEGSIRLAAALVNAAVVRVRSAEAGESAGDATTASAWHPPVELLVDANGIDEFRLLDIPRRAPELPVTFPSGPLTKDQVVRYALAFRFARLTELLAPLNMAVSSWLAGVLAPVEPHLYGDTFWTELEFALRYRYRATWLPDALWRWTVALQTAGYYALSIRALDATAGKAGSTYYEGRRVTAYYAMGDYENALRVGRAAASLPTSAKALVGAARAGRSLIRSLERSGEPATEQTPAEPRPMPVEGRVLTILHASEPHQNGGYAVRAQGLLSQLRASGWDVVAHTRPGYPYDLARHNHPLPEDGVSDVDNVRYRHSDAFRRSSGREEGYMVASINHYREIMLAERPQVVHLRSTYLTAIPGLIAAKQLGIPTIYEVSGLWELVYEGERTARMEGKRARATRLETLAAQHADKVVTLTDAMRTLIIERGADPAKVALLPNAVPAELFDDDRPAKIPDQVLALPPDVPVIGYVGSFPQYEGLEMLVPVLRRLRDEGHQFRAILVGDGSVWGSVRAAVDELEMSDWVLLPGRVPHDEVPGWYAAIDIAPFPRLRNPATVAVSPMKPFEAMLARKAVVVSDVPALAEIVGEDRGLTFTAGSASELTAALRRLLTDRELRARVGDVAHDWVRTQRTWDRVAQSFEGYLRELMRGGEETR